MALTETPPQTSTDAPIPAGAGASRTEPTAVERVLGTGDHKTIGRIFIACSLLFVASDLVIAGLVNLEAAGTDLLDATVANRFALNHPIALLFCGAMPLVLGLAIYLVPLQVGSPSIAFPRAAAMSLWAWLMGTVLFTVALLVKGAYGGSSETMSSLGHVSVGLLMVSLMVGVGCVMVTVMSHRTAGMSISRVPFFSFSMLAAGAVWLMTLPVALATITVWQIRRSTPTDLATGAFPAIEWLFHQPAVYLVAIPVLGLVADIAGGVSRRRQNGYPIIQGLIIAFAGLSFGAWSQTAESRETFIWILASVLIALPVLGLFGGALDTLRQGKLAVTGGLVLGVSSVLLVLVAVLVGVLQGLSTIGAGELFEIGRGGFADQGAGMAVGQFYLLIAAAVLAGVGATFHWGTRLVGGGLQSSVGMLLAPLALLGGLAFGLGHSLMGLTLPSASGAEAFATISAIGALVLAVAVLGAFGLVVASMAGVLGGDSSDQDAPAGTTLEWLTASPPVPGNFSEPLPVVESAYPVLDATEQGAK